MTADVAAPDGRSLRRQKNAEQIFDAAMKLLERYSYDALSVDDICNAAGVGRATFFRIFETKSGLLKEFNRRTAERINERLEDSRPKNARAHLALIAEEIANAWTRSKPGATTMIIDFSQSTPLSEVHSAHPELLAHIVDAVERGQASGEIKLHFPADFMGSLALIQLSAAASYWIEEPDLDLNALMAAALDNWLDGAAAGAGRTRSHGCGRTG